MIQMDPYQRNEIMSDIQVFVSHASEDQSLAAALVKVLRENLIIDTKHIRCTSVPGYKPITGLRFSDSLRLELVSAKAVIGLVTPNSVKSNYVLFELGAAWGGRVPTFPLMAKGATYKDLPGPLSETNARNLTTSSEISQMIQDLSKVAGFPIKTENLPLQADVIQELKDEATKI